MGPLRCYSAKRIAPKLNGAFPKALQLGGRPSKICRVEFGGRAWARKTRPGWSTWPETPGSRLYPGLMDDLVAGQPSAETLSASPPRKLRQGSDDSVEDSGGTPGPAAQNRLLSGAPRPGVRSQDDRSLMAKDRPS